MFPQIADSVCVGQSSSDKSDERVVLFLKMKSGFEFDSNLVTLVSNAIREKLSPRHVPAVILPVEDIPVSIYIYIYIHINIDISSYKAFIKTLSVY